MLEELMKGDIPCDMSMNGKHLSWDLLTKEWEVREWKYGRKWNVLYRGTDEEQVKQVLREGWRDDEDDQ